MCGSTATVRRMQRVPELPFSNKGLMCSAAPMTQSCSMTLSVSLTRKDAARSAHPRRCSGCRKRLLIWTSLTLTQELLAILGRPKERDENLASAAGTPETGGRREVIDRVGSRTGTILVRWSYERADERVIFEESLRYLETWDGPIFVEQTIKHHGSSTVTGEPEYRINARTPPLGRRDSRVSQTVACCGASRFCLAPSKGGSVRGWLFLARMRALQKPPTNKRRLLAKQNRRKSTPRPPSHQGSPSHGLDRHSHKRV